MYPKFEEIISFYDIYFVDLQTFITFMLDRATMLLLQHFITSISLVMERNLKILETKYKFEEIMQIYLLFCTCGIFIAIL